jgi:hypothetical protein
VKVDKENFSLRVPNVGAARFHIERDPGPRIRAVGVVEADIVRGIEKVTEKWKEVNGRYEVDLGIKGAGEYAIDFGLMIDLGGHEVPVPSHLTAKWNGKVLFDRTQADQRVTAHVVDGSRWYDDYTIHLTLSPVGQVKQAHPTLAILFFEHPRAPIWEIK